MVPLSVFTSPFPCPVGLVVCRKCVGVSVHADTPTRSLSGQSLSDQVMMLLQETRCLTTFTSSTKSQKEPERSWITYWTPFQVIGSMVPSTHPVFIIVTFIFLLTVFKCFYGFQWVLSNPSLDRGLLLNRGTSWSPQVLQNNPAMMVLGYFYAM